MKDCEEFHNLIDFLLSTQEKIKKKGKFSNLKTCHV